MVIFHILKYTLNGAGNSCAAVDLACTQADRGHTVYICCAVGDFQDLFAKHGVTFVELDTDTSFLDRAKALLKLHRTLKSIKPDIVHAHMIGGTLMAAALRPLLGYGFVTTVHNEFQRSAILMRLGQRVIGVSAFVSQAMVRRGVPAAKMRTVLNATIGSPRRPVPCPPAMALPHPAIVSVCGMHPRKGVLDLMEAFMIVAREFPDANLFLGGVGPMLEDYKKAVPADFADRIVFMGLLQDPRPFMKGGDIFVLASHAEPAALVLSEAREAGCAVVATDVGGNSEMLEHGKAGLLVPPQRPDALAEALLKLLRDRKYLDEMKQNAGYNLTRMSMGRLVDDVDAIYREVLPRHRRQSQGELDRVKA
jgi:glycosyltransferase involved in cell wall biosynthesis